MANPTTMDSQYHRQMVGLWHWLNSILNVIYIYINYTKAYIYIYVLYIYIYTYIYIYKYHITIQTQVSLKISKDETLELRKLPESHHASPNAAPAAPFSGSSLKATAQLPQCLTQELLSSIDNSWWKWGDPT